MENLITYINTVGLSLGVLGAFGLALLPKGFIKILPDGTEFWGPPPGIPEHEWRRQNRRTRIKQKYGLPLSYLSLGFGFLLQLLALWL
ncbi:hypothetical protein ACW7G0_14175 [Lysobacter sp. A286]